MVRFFKWFFGLFWKKKTTKTPITRDEILQYAEETPKVKRFVKKKKRQLSDAEIAEQRKKEKRLKKNRDQKQARKKNRK